MSNDEVERAISFLLENQATLAAKVDANTDAIAALTGVANTAFEVAIKTAETVALLASAQTETSQQISRLLVIVERHVSNGHGGQQP